MKSNKIVRVLALTLAVLLVLGSVISAVLALAG